MSSPVARKLAIALAVSVGLNLFLGGMITSAWIARHGFGERSHPARTVGMFDLRSGFEALGSDVRPMAREIRREYGPRLRESGREMRAARRAVANLLRADELDPAALKTAFGNVRKASDDAQAVMHQLLLETMAHLTAEQRRAFLDAATRGERKDRRPPHGDQRTDVPEPQPNDGSGN